jgi:type IV secretion system protein VirB10
MNLFRQKPDDSPTAGAAPTVSTAPDPSQLSFFEKNRKGLLLIGGCVVLLIASRLLATHSREVVKQVKAEKIVTAYNQVEAAKADDITSLQAALARERQESELKTQQANAAALAANQLTPEQLQQLALSGGGTVPQASPAVSALALPPRQAYYDSSLPGGKPAIGDKPQSLVISYREQEGHGKDIAAPPAMPVMPTLPPYGYGPPAPPAASGESAVHDAPGKVEKRAANPEDRQHELAAFAGEKFRIREGTWIPCTELLRINGSFASDINCVVSIPIYTVSGTRLLIPKGSIALGHVQAVGSQNQQRLFVVFDKFIMPDGYTVEYDNAAGLDQIGQSGLRDQVNHHYLQMFGASLAIAAVGGLAQIGNFGNTAVTAGSQYRSGLTQGMSESSTQILNRFASVLPTFIIREGARNNIHLPFNLWLPEYSKHTMKGDM